MSIVNPTPVQERQNRKLLEQLEEEKKRLRMKQAKTAGQSSSASSLPSAISGSAVLPATHLQGAVQEPQQMTAAQRAALQHAHANSVGYFITQESAFGNLVLPVLPRFDK